MGPLSILITGVLNSVSDRLAISVLVSFLGGVYSVLPSGPCSSVSSIWQPPCVRFCALDRAALTPYLVVWPIVEKAPLSCMGKSLR